MMATAATTAVAAAVRGATRLEPLVCFLFCFFIFIFIITLILFLDPLTILTMRWQHQPAPAARDVSRLESQLNMSKRRWQQQQLQRLETRHVSSSWYVFFVPFIILFYCTNIYFRSTQHVETVMAAAATAAAGTRDASSPVITWLPLPRRLVVHFLYRKWLSLMLNKIDMVDLLFDGTHLFFLNPLSSFSVLL